MSSSTSQTTSRAGRLTLPVEKGMDAQVAELLERLQADAVRNSDGTELPEIVNELATKIYQTYFVGRGDQDWARTHPRELARIYLMSERTPALADGELSIDLMTNWFVDQVYPDTDCDVERWWQVIDRITGDVIAPGAWHVDPAGLSVTIDQAQAGHVYTVGFLAVQRWDPTQMYNYLTNGWADDPQRIKESPYDIRYPQTWQHVRHALDQWLADNPQVDVVRFTTFFYHFTLVYGSDGTERFVDWFGYSASVSVPAMEAFEKRFGYPLQAEDFIDEGWYNSPFRVPRKSFRDWVSFQHEFVTSRMAELVEQVHAAGREAMMFLGDNWIGTEPYGPHFAHTGIDAVVGSVGSGATCRMISDIPGVRYTEGRLLPYFFPDVFYPGGDPVTEANASWLAARRAIVRSPLDRIGYGGYLSLAVQHPEFVDRMEEIVNEFRTIHAAAAGQRPIATGPRVAIVNCWGALRSWQTHMVAHALHYRQAYSYLGVLESLSGLPLQVDFLSFDDIRNGVPEGVEVLINVGAAGTAFSGGSEWADERVTSAVRRFVAAGGGLVGVGDPTAHPARGAVYQLSDVLGVDRELGWGLSTHRPMHTSDHHFVTLDLSSRLDVGEGTPDVFCASATTTVLAAHHEQVDLAVNQFGCGRAVYLAGLPYSSQNARLLHRALAWAGHREDAFTTWTSSDVRAEVAVYPHSDRLLVINNSLDQVTTTVSTPTTVREVHMEAAGHLWFDLELHPLDIPG